MQKWGHNRAVLYLTLIASEFCAQQREEEANILNIIIKVHT
jgi:hypothetical protein